MLSSYSSTLDVSADDTHRADRDRERDRKPAPRDPHKPRRWPNRHTIRLLYRRAKIARDLGDRLACVPARPSARAACTRAPRKPRTVPPPLPSPAPAAGLRTSSVAACRPCMSATPRGLRGSPLIIYRYRLGFPSYPFHSLSPSSTFPVLFFYQWGYMH